MKISRNESGSVRTVNVEMLTGESINITLPSGKVINVEVMGDVVDISHEDRVLFTEELSQGQWEQTWPKPE